MATYTFDNGISTAQCATCQDERLIAVFTFTRTPENHGCETERGIWQSSHAYWEIEFDCGHNVTYDSDEWTATETIILGRSTTNRFARKGHPPAPKPADTYTITFEKKP